MLKRYFFHSIEGKISLVKVESLTSQCSYLGKKIKTVTQEFILNPYKSNILFVKTHKQNKKLYTSLASHTHKNYETKML